LHRLFLNEKQVEINTNLGVTEAKFMAHGQHSAAAAVMVRFAEE